MLKHKVIATSIMQYNNGGFIINSKIKLNVPLQQLYIIALSDQNLLFYQHTITNHLLIADNSKRRIINYNIENDIYSEKSSTYCYISKQLHVNNVDPFMLYINIFGYTTPKTFNTYIIDKTSCQKLKLRYNQNTNNFY